jgi:predicted secreted Zn-dependent protease
MNIRLTTFKPIMLAIAVFLAVVLLNQPTQAQQAMQQILWSTQANPSITVDTNYYSITGSTAQQLRDQLNQLRPSDEKTGKRFDAYTRWSVRWDYRYSNNSDSCQISEADVKTKIVITLPQWQIPANPSKPLVNKWNRYMAALRSHEDGHKNHGIAASQEILSLLQQFPKQASCSQLSRAANQAAQLVIKKYNQRDLEYDRVTKHGATQGAKFP